MAKVKGKKIGVAGVDTGMLLIIDPAYLFTQEEWRGVSDMAGRDLNAWPRVILEALSDKVGDDLTRLGVVAQMDGDGGRQVTRTEDGVFIED